MTAARELRFEPARIAGRHGARTTVAERGILEVPERCDRSGRTLRLGVLKLSGNPEGTPLLFADGGPGDDTLGNLAARPAWFERAAAIGDVYLLDQRGCRWASADLDVHLVHRFEPGDLVDRDLRADAWRALFARALDDVRRRGVDPHGYTAPAIAADYVALADAAGLTRFNFHGLSFASQVGQLLLRDHSERLERMHLWGIEPLDGTIKLPRSLGAQLRRVEVALDGGRRGGKLPALQDMAQSLRQRLDSSPVPVRPRGARQPLWFGAILVDAAMTLAMTRTGARRLHAVLHGLRDDPTSLAPRIVRRFHLDRVELDNLQEYLVDGSLGASAKRWSRVLAETAERCPMGGFCQEALLALRHQLKPFDLGDGVRAPATGETPVYIYNGSLDANTPLENLPGVVAGLPNAHVAIVDGLDHSHATAQRFPELAPLEDDIMHFLGGGRPAVSRIAVAL